MLNLAQALDASQFSTTIVAIGPADELAGFLPHRLPVIRLDAPRLRGSLVALSHTLRRLNPDIVVSTLGYLNLALLAIRPFLGARTQLVVREANVVSASLRALPRIIPGRWLYRSLYPKAALIIAQTDEIAREILEVAPGARGKIEILKNPVDVSNIRSSAQDLLRMPGVGLRLAAAGRLVKQKGFDRLIALMPNLPADTQLTIFGEGSERGALQAQIDTLGLNARVHLPGFSGNLAGALAAADLLVLPSRWEGIPNIALEALALGTPVVASREAAMQEIAAAASPGAVTIADVEKEFAMVIRSFAPGMDSRLRDSLLPDEFRIEAVGARFSELLARVARAAP